MLYRLRHFLSCCPGMMSSCHRVWATLDPHFLIGTEGGLTQFFLYCFCPFISFSHEFILHYLTFKCQWTGVA
jgi:hypothetical protein